MKKICIVGLLLAVLLFVTGCTVSALSPEPKEVVESEKEEVLKSQKPEVNNSLNPDEEVLTIRTELESSSYPQLTVVKDKPVRWIIQADAKNLNGCNDEIVMEAFGVLKVLEEGENIIEFTPKELGVFDYSCWMGMLDSTVTVVADESEYEPPKTGGFPKRTLKPGSPCCGG